jgi:hypothetical protein
MGQYIMVLIETPNGKSDHRRHGVRRALAQERAGYYQIAVGHISDVETPPGSGNWTYIWPVSDPSDSNVYKLRDIFNYFGYVTCTVFPLPYLEELLRR